MADKPAHKCRIGFVTATIWENQSNGNAFYTVTMSRSYKDGEDYKETDNLGHSDLLNAAKVLTRAEDWIANQ